MYARRFFFSFQFWSCQKEFWFSTHSELQAMWLSGFPIQTRALCHVGHASLFTIKERYSEFLSFLGGQDSVFILGDCTYAPSPYTRTSTVKITALKKHTLPFSQKYPIAMCTFCACRKSRLSGFCCQCVFFSCIGYKI